MKKYNHEWLIAEWKRMGRPEVERYSVSWEEWNIDEDPKFIVYFQYRIKSKPWINWEHVSESLTWLATRPDGSYLFTAEPSMPSLKWESKYTRASHEADNFSSFTQGTCDWRDSLVMRPVVIG
jgi:hypothetical protein